MRIAALAAFGATCTLALAWSSAIYSNPTRGTATQYSLQSHDGAESFIVDIDGAFFRRRTVDEHGIVRSPIRYGWPHLADDAINADIPCNHSSGNALPAWRGSGPLNLLAFYTDEMASSPSDITLPDQAIPSRSPLIIATGWPWLAMECTVQRYELPSSSQAPMPDHPLTLAIGGLLLDTNPDAVSDLEIKVLPLRPAWGGFALDTALFAAIAGTGWLLLTTFTHLRRYRRGRCPHCAYNRLGNYTGPCPECGHSAATR